jgi:hypothetical protein
MFGDTYHNPGIIDPREELYADNPDLRPRTKAAVPAHLDLETSQLLIYDRKAKLPLPALLVRMNELITSGDIGEQQAGYAMAVQLLPYFHSKAPVAEPSMRDKVSEDMELAKAHQQIGKILSSLGVPEEAQQNLAAKAQVIPIKKGVDPKKSA